MWEGEAIAHPNRIAEGRSNLVSCQAQLHTWQGVTIMTIQHIESLDKKITALSDALAHLGKGTDMKELLKIIHNPGWTTPAEFELVNALIDSVQAHTQVLQKTQQQLLAACKQVGRQ
jgi:hypothetical protein